MDIDWFIEITNMYEQGYWDINKVHDAVGRVIDEDQFKQITGQEYVK